MFLKGVFVCAVDCFFPGSVLMLQKVFPGSVLVPPVAPYLVARASHWLDNLLHQNK